jgi:lipoprotein-anchoring transpeptidase ErfK/SrfK
MVISPFTARTRSGTSAAVSHGCVRLHPVNTRTLFEIIKGTGPGNARIVVTS